jgi:(E)-4-hydroxy-3-methylbut-2-enyl-diphosphate synthase
LRGEGIADEFKQMVLEYIEKRYGDGKTTSTDAA